MPKKRTSSDKVTKTKASEDLSSTKESPFPLGFSSQPWLIQTPGTKKGSLKFINLLNGSIERKKIPEMQGKLCLQYFEEWFLLLDVLSKEMFLLNLNLDSKVCLPPMLEPAETLGACVFTSSPTSSKCMIIFVLKNQKFMLHCRPKDQNWTKFKCNISEANFFSGEIVTREGNLYARLTPFSDNFVIFTTVESLITGIANWSTIWWNFFLFRPNNFQNLSDAYNTRKQRITHMVAFREEVLLVMVFFYERAVTDVCIFSFQFGENGKRPYWRREKDVNRCVFFLGGKNNISFAMNHDSMQHDCIYLLRSYDEKELLIYKIDIDDQTSLFRFIPDEVLMDRQNLCWIVSSGTRKMKKEIGTSSHMMRSIENDVTDISTEEERAIDISRQWADIPTDLLELLLSKLSLVDRIYIPTVCKAWSLVPTHLHEAKTWPWLMYCPKDTRQCRFIDPLNGKEYHMDLDFLGFNYDKIILHFSNNGWVLLSCGSGNNMYIINPLTRETIKLPPRMGNNLSFSSVPTSPDFIVFGIRFFDLFTWRLGEETSNHLSSSSNPGGFVFACNHPVFFLGQVYCLGRTGNLAVFDLETKKCTILDLPAPIYSEIPASDKEDGYLMEIGGELISVFPGNEGIESSFRVFKLDQFEMDWIELDDLGDLTLFIDRRTSIAKRAPLKSCANRIYFPRFDVNMLGAFYSMETDKCYPDVYGLTEPLNCVWIEPNLDSQT